MKYIKSILLSIPLLLCGCVKEGDRTPLDWCLWEIEKHQGYECCLYTYEEISPKNYKLESKNNVDGYFITTYTEDKRTEWCCFIEYTKTMKRFLNEYDVFLIDCDIIYEINIEGEIF